MEKEVTKEKKETYWSSKTPKEKRNFFIILAASIFAIGLLLVLMFARQLFGDEIGDKIYGEGVLNGFVFIGNVVSSSILNVVFTLITIVSVFFAIIIINFFIKLFSRGTKRSQTTGSLISSLVRYVGIIIGVGVTLAIWGVDVTGIVASLGILTLIIGLGCQSLISDVVSGLFIVFDDYFSVGDMVIIDGFRGYVTEIGLKTVKIDDRCGNVKAITNSSISTCVNLSRSNNYISFTLDAAYGEDIERLEAIFSRELPKIKEKIPAIIDGPIYKGIDGFSAGGVSHLFAFYCDAPDRFQAIRDCKREIYQMFIRNDILVPYSHIVVDKPEPVRPKATKEEKEASERFIRKNRAPKLPKKKEKIAARIKKAAKDSLEQVDPLL